MVLFSSQHDFQNAFQNHRFSAVGEWRLADPSSLKRCVVYASFVTACKKLSTFDAFDPAVT